jgi:hypothetical protein
MDDQSQGVERSRKRFWKDSKAKVVVVVVERGSQQKRGCRGF